MLTSVSIFFFSISVKFCIFASFLGQFCPALPKALKTMRKGEKVNLIIQPQCMSPPSPSYLLVEFSNLTIDDVKIQ